MLLLSVEFPVFEAINSIAVVLIYLWVFWTLFVLTMGFYRAKLDGRLKGLTFFMALPWVAAAWVIDVVANLTLATVIFLDAPLEWTVTARFQRYIRKERSGWRYRIALWVCNNLLDVFDPRGEHC